MPPFDLSVADRCLSTGGSPSTLGISSIPKTLSTQNLVDIPGAGSSAPRGFLGMDVQHPWLARTDCVLERWKKVSRFIYADAPCAARLGKTREVRIVGPTIIGPKAGADCAKVVFVLVDGDRAVAEIVHDHPGHSDVVLHCGDHGAEYGTEGSIANLGYNWYFGPAQLCPKGRGDCPTHGSPSRPHVILAACSISDVHASALARKFRKRWVFLYSREGSDS